MFRQQLGLPSFLLSFVCLIVQRHQALSLSISYRITTQASKSTTRTCMMSSNDNNNINSNKNNEIKVLGVCGGIGSGKSSASKLLVSDLGCIEHLDADKIAHTVYEPGSQAIQDVVKGFGSQILEESNPEVIDRKKLGAIVFGDRNEMKKLEHIVWPHVKTKLRDRIEQIRAEWKKSKQPTTEEEAAEQPIIILEAAVLLDAGWEDILDGIWVVTASESTALQRLKETRNLSEEEAMKRITAQNTRRGIGNLNVEVETGIVTGVIENNGTMEDLKTSLQEALENPKSWKK